MSLCLAIETSCDETSVAVIKNGSEVLANVVSSSSKLFEETGGVVPEVAARAQVEYIVPCIQKALDDANLSIEQIDYFAVTKGPGLVGSLLVGITCAKTLSLIYKKPLLGINHLYGHVFSVFITKYLGQVIQNRTPKIPSLCLVVSGGHTDIAILKNTTTIKYLGGTIDDAVGESFDKIARLLGLSKYLGGKDLSLLAKTFKGFSKLQLPRPLINSNNFDFSFSGLKTATKLAFEKNYKKEEIAFDFEQAVVDVLMKKIDKALNTFKLQSIIVGGGVIANEKLRKTLVEKYGTRVFIPPLYLCGDNAAMIGCAAHFLYKKLVNKKFDVDPNLSLDKAF